MFMQVKLVILFCLLFIPSVFAGDPPYCYKESDGDPKACLKQLAFPNGSLTSSGNTVTVDLPTQSSNDTRYVNVTGDTMTGDLTISGNGDSPSLIFSASGGDQTSEIFHFFTDDRLVVSNTTGNIELNSGGILSYIKLISQATAGGEIYFGHNGVLVTEDRDGAWTWQGLGNGNDENLKLNFDDGSGGANTIEVTSSTGVNRIDFTDIGLKRDELILLCNDANDCTPYNATADTDAARLTAFNSANTAAVSGDTLYVLNGNISSGSTITLKSGVTYHFSAGTSFTCTHAGACFSDGGSDVTTQITGFGRFISTGTNGASVFKPEGANSSWHVTGLSCKTTSNNESTPCINPVGTGGTVNHVFTFYDYCWSTGYDCLWNNGAEGTVTLTTPLCKGGGQCLEHQSGNPLGGDSITYLNVTKAETTSTQAAIYVWSGDKTYTYVNNCTEIKGNNLAIETEGTVVANINCQTIKGKVLHEGGTVRISDSTIDNTGMAQVPIVVSGSGLTLKDVNIITDSGQTNSITSTSNTITIAGALKYNKPPDSDTVFTGGSIFDSSTSQFQFPHTLVPKTSDGSALGTGTLMWSDIFLASGAVLNFNNGNLTATHSADLLTFSDPIATGGTSQSTVDEGLIVNNLSGGDADDDLVVNGDTVAGLLTVDVSEDDIEMGGHVETTGTAPTLSSCGTSPSISTTATDMGGKITIGTSASDTCTLTFNSGWTNAPSCNVTGEDSAITLAATTTTTTLIVTAPAATDFSSDVIMYNCFGQE